MGGKLADKLVNELGAIFGKPLKPKTKLIQPENGGEAFEVEEIKLRTGEYLVMSHLLNSFTSKYLLRLPRYFKPKKSCFLVREIVCRDFFGDIVLTYNFLITYLYGMKIFNFYKLLM